MFAVPLFWDKADINLAVEAITIEVADQAVKPKTGL